MDDDYDDRCYYTPNGKYYGYPVSIGRFIQCWNTALGMRLEDQRITKMITNGEPTADILLCIKSAGLPPETKENLLFNLRMRRKKR